MTTSEVVPLPRCCDQHDSWRVLAEHLVSDFVDVPAGDVVREIGRAKAAVETFGIEPGDQIAVAELMARHQLMLLDGQLPDIARLDPERHLRGAETT